MHSELSILNRYDKFILKNIDAYIENPKTVQKQFRERVDWINLFLLDVCRYFKIELNELLYKGRDAEYVFPRQCAAYVLHKYTDISTGKLGKKLNKDHSFVWHSSNVINNYIDTDEIKRNKVDVVCSMIKVYLNYD